MDIKAIAAKIIRKYNTNSPFRIAKEMGVLVLYYPLKTTLGRYTKYCRIKSIIINNNADESLWKFICAHELAHSLLHPNMNMARMISASPYMNASRFENEANLFAVELLLPDSDIAAHPNWTKEFHAKNSGIPVEMIRLKKFPRKES